jgi:hypothetical protein
MILLHHGLDRQRGGDLQRHARIMTFAMARGARHQRLQGGDSRHL